MGWHCQEKNTFPNFSYRLILGFNVKFLISLNSDHNDGGDLGVEPTPPTQSSQKGKEKVVPALDSSIFTQHYNNITLSDVTIYIYEIQVFFKIQYFELKTSIWKLLLLFFFIKSTN